MMSLLREQPYEERLKPLNFVTLEMRQLRESVIQVFKYPKVDYAKLLELHINQRTLNISRLHEHKKGSTDISMSLVSNRVPYSNKLPVKATDGGRSQLKITFAGSSFQRGCTRLSRVFVQQLPQFVLQFI